MYGNSQFVVVCVCNLLRGKGKNWITRCKCCKRKAGVRFRLRGTFSSSFFFLLWISFCLWENSLYAPLWNQTNDSSDSKTEPDGSCFPTGLPTYAQVYVYTITSGESHGKTTTTGFWQSKKGWTKVTTPKNKISFCLIRHPVNSQRQNGILCIDSQSLPRCVKISHGNVPGK